MKKIVPTLACFAMVACGGGGGSSNNSTTNDTTDAVERNVAAKDNGATVTATYDSSGASYVIDGDITESFFWSANVTGDELKIDFGQTVSVSDITIYTNDMIFSTSNPSKIIEVSKDNTTWLETSNIIAGDIPCQSSNIGGGKMFCSFSSAQDLRYLKIRITEESEPELIKIFEVDVTGI